MELIESPDTGSGDPTREVQPYGTLVGDVTVMSDREILISIFQDMRAIRLMVEKATDQVVPVIEQVKSNPMLAMFFS